MNIQLISDSCCDVTPVMRKTLDLKLAPLKITVDGTKCYVDEPGINIKQLLADMKASKRPIATAAPAPEDFARLMRAEDASVVVTLGQKLSGTYNAAMAARDMVLEESPDKSILVFDSKSASAGQLPKISFHALLTQSTGFWSLNVLTDSLSISKSSVFPTVLSCIVIWSCPSSLQRPSI